MVNILEGEHQQIKNKLDRVDLLLTDPSRYNSTTMDNWLVPFLSK